MNPTAILYSFLPLWAISPLLIVTSPPSALSPITMFEDQTSLSAASSTLLPQLDARVSTIAFQVTVRILADSSLGSGVIVRRQGRTYTVLTNAHVLDDSQGNRYKILTPDGRTYSGWRLHWAEFEDRDLALVQFRSDRDYQVAAMGDSQNLAIGDPVYAAGFPSWQRLDANAIAETRDWGTKAFRLTSGRVAMLPEKSLQEGYQLGYTNDIELGMSGGPVLDRNGHLIGINGKSKYPPQGIVAFIFADGTLPSPELFQQMETLSWAIPAAKFRQAIR